MLYHSEYNQLHLASPAGDLLKGGHANMIDFDAGPYFESGRSQMLLAAFANSFAAQ